MQGLDPKARDRGLEHAQPRLVCGRAIHNAAVYYLGNGQFIAVSTVPGAFVGSITGDGVGNLWIGYQTEGPRAFSPRAFLT